jgi:hypothetical protein
LQAGTGDQRAVVSSRDRASRPGDYPGDCTQLPFNSKPHRTYGNQPLRSKLQVWDGTSDSAATVAIPPAHVELLAAPVQTMLIWCICCVW